MSVDRDYTIRMVARVSGQAALIKALLSHPMQNGFNKTASGEFIPPHYITEVTLRINGDTVASIQTGSGIAADPLFGWRIAGVKPGDRVQVSWHDNQGNERSKETTAQ